MHFKHSFRTLGQYVQLYTCISSLYMYFMCSLHAVFIDMKYVELLYLF